MKRILFVISSMQAGGAERVMSLLANYSAASGVETAIALMVSDRVAYDLDPQIKIYPPAERSRNRFLAMTDRFTWLRSCIKDFKPDAIVSFLTVINIYTRIASVGLGIPVIVSERNDPVRDCTERLKKIARDLCYRLASGVIFQTKDAQEYFSKAIQKKSVVIPNPVKDDLPFADLPNREKTVVAAGRLMPQKNYPMMLKAFRQFADNHPEYQLHIYGDGYQHQQLAQLAEDLEISDRVQFMGIAKDLHQRITRAGMFVLSSDYEGISNSLLEAMSMGLPCISTDCPCGGSRYLIEDGVNGLLVPVGDAESLARAMSRIADDDAFAAGLGQQALKTRDAHKTETIIGKYFDFIKKISEG